MEIFKSTCSDYRLSLLANQEQRFVLLFLKEVVPFKCFINTCIISLCPIFQEGIIFWWNNSVTLTLRRITWVSQLLLLTSATWEAKPCTGFKIKGKREMSFPMAEPGYKKRKTINIAHQSRPRSLNVYI